MRSRVLTIIGNGFDIGHGLPTRFSDFINSNKKELEPKYMEYRKEGEDWNEIESTYGRRLMEVIDAVVQFDVSEEVDYILDNYGLDEYGEVAFYNYESEAFVEQIEDITSKLNLLRSFESDFKEYLEHVCSDSVLDELVPYRQIRDVLESSSKIINFNYTLTVEVVYNIPNVEHIHGKVDTSIAIGTSSLEVADEALMDATYPTPDMFSRNKFGLQESMRYWDYDWDEDSEIEPDEFPMERSNIKRFFDEVAGETSRRVGIIIDLIDEKNKNNLDSRKKIIQDLRDEHYDEAIVINHSLGEADHDVFKAINRDAFIRFYYYTESDKINAEAFLMENGWKYEMIQSDCLYSS